MKLIISFQDGQVLMLSVAGIDSVQFIGNELHIVYGMGNSSDYFMKDIRSVVIA